jgi:hypothetical protein
VVAGAIGPATTIIPKPQNFVALLLGLKQVHVPFKRPATVGQHKPARAVNPIIGRREREQFMRKLEKWIHG